MAMISLFTKKPFGLYINDTNIQILQLKGSETSAKVLAVGEKEIPNGIVDNGKIIKTEKLAGIIKDLLQEQNQAFDEKKCILALPESQSYETVAYLPSGLKGETLNSAVATKIAERLPFLPSQLKYDFVTHENENGIIAFAVAVKKEIIAEYYEVLNHYLQLKPLVFEPASLSLMRSILLKQETDQAFILAYCSENTTMWFLIWKNFIFDSNIIKNTGKDFTDILCDDLKKSTAFFTENTSRTVEKIILMGKSGTMESLEQYLQNTTSISVSHTFQYRIGENDISTYNITDPFDIAIVAGAALQPFQIQADISINLIRQ